MAYDYDLLVIGAGPGGLAASEQAVAYGAKVAIAEQDRVGGACVIRGCIPEKLMSFAANFAHLEQDAEDYGWHSTQPDHKPMDCVFDWQQFVANRDREVQRLSQRHQSALEQAGINLIRGCAQFVDAHTIEVGGRPITADKILIATGARDIKLCVPGIEYAISSPEVFQLKQQPQHVAVLGGNYISVKLGGILRRLGSQVTMVIAEDRILADFDRDLALAIQSSLREQGMQILDKTHLKAIAPTSDGSQGSPEQSQNGLNLTLATEQTLQTKDSQTRDSQAKDSQAKNLQVDTVLSTLGRQANIEHLNLERAGVAIQDGAIGVDQDSRTSQPHIFALGDCTNRPHWTPVAIASARAFGRTEFGNQPETIAYEFIPATVSAHPEAATVGLSETQAQAKFGQDSVRCYSTRFRPLFYNLIERDEQTFMKLVVEKQSDRVLGAHMMGPCASEIVQCLAIALRVGVTKRDFDATIGIHPSTAEELFTL